MSAFGGFYNWDRRRVSNEAVHDMGVYLHAAGPDGCETLRPSPGLAMQSHLLHFDRLSTKERQPHIFGQGNVLTWNGRLDNRDDLALVLHKSLGTDRTDAAIVAAAYERWGVDAIPRLIGDWCLAIWDAPQQRMILACDYMGNRPLYYRATKERLAWATGLQALAAAEGRFDAHEDLYLAGYVSGRLPDDMTLYSGIVRLVSGHILVVTRDSTTLRRYWIFTPSTVRYRTLDQYAEHLRQLVIEAIRVRLRSIRPVWAHLSGGWDSSSIVCVAHRLIAQREVEAPSLNCISIVYPDREAEIEREYIRSVEQWCGLSTLAVNKLGPTTFAERLGQRVIAPRDNIHRLDRIVQEAGDRVVLSGRVGDIMGMPVRPWASAWESLRDGRLSQYARRAVTWAQAESVAVPVLLTRMARNDYQPRRRSRGRPPQETDTHPIAPHLAAELLSRRPTAWPSIADFPKATQPVVEMLYEQGERGLMVDELCQPVLQTHPYSHRPLTEFLLAIPRSCMFEPGFPRAGMERALRDVLPQMIRDRRSDVGVSPLPERRLRLRLLEGMMQSPPLTEPAAAWQLVQRGIVEPRPLAAAIDKLRHVARPSDFLNRAVAVEAWLRSLPMPSERSPDKVESRTVATAEATF